MQSIIEQLTNGTIPRIPLLAPGQGLDNLAHGAHAVTGGFIQIGYLGDGNKTKMIGILVNNMPIHFNGVYVPGNQPFNSNFACVLFEMKQAGTTHISLSNLDYSTGNRGSHLHNDFVHSYRDWAGHNNGKPTFGQIGISDALINGIAR